MKYSELKQIVERQAAVARRDAALTGSCGDGGSDKLLNRLSDFKNSLVVRYDLKPSEFRDLDNIEVGEPGAFTSAIYNYRKEQSQKKMNTEKETQARVDFKMKELLTAVENTAKTNWNIALQNNSQKHSHYWEAFGQMKQMLTKEMQMATPHDDMAEQKRRKKRDEAIGKIMERFCKRGERDYHEKELLLASIIENAQNW